MTTNQPLTLTVEQAAEVLGVGRSTAYELVHSGDLKCIHLRRRIVVPVAHLAESLGVDRETVWETLGTEAATSVGLSGGDTPSKLTARAGQRPTGAARAPTLF